MWSCLRNRLRCSCRSLKTRLADCCRPSTDRRRRNLDYTRKDPTVTALHPHTGSSGVEVTVSMMNEGENVRELDILRYLVDFFVVSAGWNDTRLNVQPWRQQPRYVSVTSFVALSLGARCIKICKPNLIVLFCHLHFSGLIRSSRVTTTETLVTADIKVTAEKQGARRNRGRCTICVYKDTRDVI